MFYAIVILFVIMDFCCRVMIITRPSFWLLNKWVTSGEWGVVDFVTGVLVIGLVSALEVYCRYFHFVYGSICARCDFSGAFWVVLFGFCPP